MTHRILVTGGSGFIGTNLVEFFLSNGYEVLNIDINAPADKSHTQVFKKVDILKYSALVSVFDEFAPTEVVHLAAQTDLLGGKSYDYYAANTTGVQNMVEAISNQPSIQRSFFASTKLICETGYTPTSNDDYCPDNLYGKSKVQGEEIVKNSTTMKCAWCIVRPTSIWGPWSTLPSTSYGRFFQTVSRGHYFHPGRMDTLKSFGYIGNTVFQIKKLIDASIEQINKKVFYLSDYEPFTIKDWADTISMKMNHKKPYTMPDILVKFLTKVGDLTKLLGYKDPPISTFRLKNMNAETSEIPLEQIKSITGPLPYTMQQGVEETIEWLKKFNYIK